MHWRQLLPVLELVKHDVLGQQLALQLLRVGLLICCQLPQCPAVAVAQPCLSGQTLIGTCLMQHGHQVFWTQTLLLTILKGVHSNDEAPVATRFGVLSKCGDVNALNTWCCEGGQAGDTDAGGTAAEPGQPGMTLGFSIN